MAVYQGPGQMPEWAHPLMVIGTIVVLVVWFVLMVRIGKGGK